MASDAFVRIDDRWSRDGLPVVTLENRYLRVVVGPSRGARVLHFQHRDGGTDILWQNPRIAHRVGTARHVALGESHECDVRANRVEGAGHVTGISNDGRPL